MTTPASTASILAARLSTSRSSARRGGRRSRFPSATTAFVCSRLLIWTTTASSRSFARRGHGCFASRLGYRELGGAPLPREFVSGETFHYLGRPYRLKVVPDQAAVVTRIIARGSSLVAPVLPDANSHGPPRGREKRASPLVSRSREGPFSGSRGGHGETTRRSRRRPSMSSINRNAGAVATRAARIRLNWRLVMAPMTLVDYVIAHEACHVLEHNHSRRFWRSLETIMPDYENRVRQLDRLGRLYARSSGIDLKNAERGNVVFS